MSADTRSKPNKGSGGENAGAPGSLEEAGGKSSLQRGLAILRLLASSNETGARLTDISRALDLTPPTVHRLLKILVEEGMAEADKATKRYRLGIDLFGLAAQAGNPNNLRDICRPILLRLSATLRDTIFLLVRSGFDAVCLDRSEGPFPIRSFTGDIGGRVTLGVGQGSLAIMAFLHEEEREEVIRFNLPRMQGVGIIDEVYLRTEIARVRDLGYASRSTGLLPGMSGVAVPVLDRDGHAVAALSVGTISERLNEERLPVVVDILKRESAAISRQLNPFDPVLRRPAAILGGGPA
ncbi:IclR family transcriptional regulator (plasmid) [Azospirillum oryzae]|uniref:IclR family transcriptional regulator n=1 Tax=Azospirillum oryzae TaxID=286727 RepID=A0A6N1AR21_9PROT|nr:IclR family transcriptional regulator [Azospirillum oryzae]QKS54231.1 IclR family transcriptional regulator [Azospirillum oryzae]GLR80212.1 IclR family transcriptional regulator [Azospirillum oryzae]